MIKKITLFLLILCCVISCGKKGDPKYKESERIEMENIVIKIV